MILSELRKTGTEILARAGFDDPARECDYLLSGALNMPLLEIRIAVQKEIPPECRERLEDFFRRRAGHEPAQYILGTAPFRDLELEVTPAVLIPRPETEELVSLALTDLPRESKVLDMGTGSGAIPIALKYERPDLHVTASDLSQEALTVARRNSLRWKTQIEFVLSDLWQNLEGRSFDLVTANLPYVSEEEYAQCAPEIFFEPVMALTAPDQGLELMKKAISGLAAHLNRGGTAIFELSDQQNALICGFGKNLGFTPSAVYDMEGKARFAVLKRENF